MPSNSNSRASGPKNPTKTAPSNVNGTGQAATGAKINPSALDTSHLQPKATGTSNLNQKGSVGSASSPQIPHTAASEPKAANGSTPTNEADSSGPAVNRKKQKRRQKQAARLAAEQPLTTGSSSNQAYIDANAIAYNDVEYALSTTQAHAAQVNTNGYGYEYDDPEYEPGEGEDQFYSDEDARLLEKPFSSMRKYDLSNLKPSEVPGAKAKKKKKNKSNSISQPGYQTSYETHGHPYPNVNTSYQPPPPPPPPALSTAALRSAHHISKDRIWNTSTAEERERIKEFWLSLGEEDRRSLVKVEKEAVLKKMKEQQKHSCSCTVCGRKRTAIEEELEVLYDAYYEELEQYANHQQIDGTSIIPPRRGYGRPMGRMPPSRTAQGYISPCSSRGRIEEVADDEEEGDDEDYEDDDDEEEEDDEDDEDEDISDGEPEEPPIGHTNDFFNFGNSLTVQGALALVFPRLFRSADSYRRYSNRCR